MTSNYPMRDNRSFGLSSSGGLAAVEAMPMNPSGLLNSGAGAPMSMPNFPGVNDKSTSRDEKTVGIPFAIKALPGDYQMAYQEGHFLFTYKPEEGVKEQRYTALSIPVLNFLLEQAARFRGISSKELGALEIIAQAAAPGPRADADVLKKRRIGQDPDPFFNFPVTLQQVRENIFPLGGFLSPNDKARSRERSLGLGIHGRLVNADLWPKASVGDYVGVMAQEVDNTYDSFYDPNGTGMGPATRGRYIQIVPWHERETPSPVIAGDFQKPKALVDAACYETKIIKQDVYEEDKTTGLLTRTVLGADTPVITEIFQQCPVWVFGRLKRRTQLPTQQEVHVALRSHAQWQALYNRCRAEIIMDLTARGNLHLV